MYPNIKTPHALHSIGSWINKLPTRPDFPRNFPIKAVKTAMTITMSNNHFEFGNINYLQVNGTAMGASLGASWATCYSSVHEACTLLPKYSHCLIKIADSSLVQWINDLCGIWLCPHFPSALQCHHW